MSSDETAYVDEFLPDPEVIRDPLLAQQVRETLVDGIVVGVWHVAHEDAHVLAGRVRLCDDESAWLAEIEPKSEISYTLPDAGRCTVLEDRLRDEGPPRDVRDPDVEQEVYCSNPGLCPQDDGTLELLHSGAVHDSRGVRYYTADSLGSVTHIETFPARGPLEEHSVGHDGAWWWWNTSRIGEPVEEEDDDALCELCGEPTDGPYLTSDSHPAGPNLVVCSDCAPLQGGDDDE